MIETLGTVGDLDGLCGAWTSADPKKLDDSKGVVTFGYDQNSKGNYPSSVNGMLIYRNSFFNLEKLQKHIVLI